MNPLLPVAFLSVLLAYAQSVLICFYWGKMENVDSCLLIAIMLDPQYKLTYANYCFGDIYEGKIVACNVTNLEVVTFYVVIYFFESFDFG